MLFPTLDTPAVVIDLVRADANLARVQAYADAHGIRLRPHIKTHKLPRLALRQLELGAIGITCQKLGEAEVMADAGVGDILIPYNLIGPMKLARLKALQARTRLIVSADSAATVAGYAATFAGAERPLDVLVECDTGMHRCGVTTAAEAVALARAIAASPGLSFQGILTYPAAGRWREALDRLADIIRHLTEAGLPPRIVSSGGTPDLFHAHEGAGIVTDYRPGTYVYSDRSQVARGYGTLEDCALAVLATVVSAPTADRVVVDAGSKALTSDLLGMHGHGYLPAYPAAVVASLSEEHAVIDVSACPRPPAIGERVLIVPNHACVVSNLFDTVHLVAADGRIEAVPVAARGRVA